ncbi:MAG: preprotein translocase subunit SecE [Candidatus Omnitrophica bacterium]|nr:preprotein translocase subunit SecE [Candidatus Omnitrophota bacterium]
MIAKLKKIPQFFKEVKEELKKVNWTTRKELMGAAVVVVVVSAILTAYIFAIDMGLAKLMKTIVG